MSTTGPRPPRSFRKSAPRVSCSPSSPASQPEPEWEGCLVYKGAAPDDSARMVCIGMSGPSAIKVQEKLVETFEATGIPVPTIYEGGPEPQLELAKVTNGKWASP